MPIMKTSDSSLSVVTSFFGLFKLNAHVKPEETGAIESVVSTNDQREAKGNFVSNC
ncbi:hypothetical protein [Legionella sainthelensi]|uniref:hypothetical protein n=1 Tax=Legionella sainthelensi TaxID=28087 RepID=UPI002165B257|nr:hypothetical protein [Legionella sainthelensi]